MRNMAFKERENGTTDIRQLVIDVLEGVGIKIDPLTKKSFHSPEIDEEFEQKTRLRDLIVQGGVKEVRQAAEAADHMQEFLRLSRPQR